MAKAKIVQWRAVGLPARDSMIIPQASVAGPLAVDTLDTAGTDSVALNDDAVVVEVFALDDPLSYRVGAEAQPAGDIDLSNTVPVLSSSRAELIPAGLAGSLKITIVAGVD